MRIVDLFCGCGGFSLGFERAGHEVVAAFDNWDKALDVYAANFSHDVRKFDLSDDQGAAREVRGYAPEMIIGGPPCQDFSSAGKRDEDNGRGDLTISYARIVVAVRPRWFVMENVARIMKTQKLVEAKRIFKAAGYGLTYQVLDASLCGVPQKRKRFVMVGLLDAADGFLADTLQGNLAKQPMSVADYFGDKLGVKFYYRHPRSYVRRGVFSVDEPSPTIRGVNRPMPKGYQRHPGDPVEDLAGIRPLTTAERAQIQTFPENFRFLGSKTDVEQMIGNAVPVNLGRFVGKAVQDYEDFKTTLFEPEAKYSKNR